MKSLRTLKYILSTLFIVGATIFGIVQTLSSLRNEAIQTQHHIANLHAYTFDEHFAQILQQVDHTIDRIPYLSNHRVIESIVAPILVELLHNAHYVRSLSLLDEQGRIIASSYSPNVGKRIALENFLPIPFGETSILRVGVPWEGRDFDEGRPSTHELPISSNALSFIPLLKKIFFAQKAYFVIANLNTDYFANRYNTILPIEAGAVSLWRIDGTLLFSNHTALLAGSTHYTNEHPKQPNDTDFFSHLKNNVHKDMTVFHLNRLMPFILEVAINERNALVVWDKERQKVLGITTLLIGLLGTLGLTLVVRTLNEFERQKQQLAYEKQFRTAMEATQTGLWTRNYQTGEITWDAQCYLLLDYAPNAFTPSIAKIDALTDAKDAPYIATLIDEQIVQKGHFIVERRMKKASGEWVWIDVRGKVIEYTPEGEPLLLTGVYINIDAQKKAEQLHLLAVAFETQEAILITDAHESVIKVNDAFTRITGYEEEEILGKTPRLLCSGKHDKAFYEAMWDALCTKGFWQGELWNKRKNGEIYAEHLTITTIKDAKGETTHFLANFNDITSQKKAEQHVQELAYQDPLTHLFNRTVLDTTLQTIVEKQTQIGLFGAIIFIDFDHFKELNDTYGHDAGDILLIQAANRLRDATRQKDTVVRFGGDEFIVVLEELGHNKAYALFQARTVAQKILSRLGEPYALAHGNYFLGASIGVSLFGDDAAKEAHTLIKEADCAMYKAKEAGRNQIYIFNADDCSQNAPLKIPQSKIKS